ncbi:transposase [Curtobacterium sp. Leaf183]|uniref:transposase n=1 Tax=Curtobacterium sp. Leaf183 TaxID=1736291 RepID=UPI0039E1C003
MFILRRAGREFTPEFKDEAVKLVTNTGRTVAEVARELGVLEVRWAEGWKSSGPAGHRQWCRDTVQSG